MAVIDTFARSAAAKFILFGLLLLPLLYLLVWVLLGDIGSDPALAVVEYLAVVAFNLLLVTVSITPVRRLTGFSWMARFRRMLGLYTYFYASLHVAAYLLFLADWQNIQADLLKRPYMFVGLGAFLLLSVLAITSNKWSMRRLAKKWVVVHRLVYLIILLVLVHFVWQERADYFSSFIYFSIILVLFVARFGLSGFQAGVRRKIF
ncbi:sulfite oxidase heme-binding subunit YedZ [Alkalimarinus coralli]|uniref:sulfite oxidase heme-binding subunit YedZ n=1 Tax=Alkalimarinus coralli TaxID=2935863 RepID=UPI00202AD391|nr:ferric reductase-like transmembrane domain-containing protein [Alkalimarinus coralli]